MISVIIPTYNEEKNIKRCLESLENQTVPRNEFEVIIVDGQSKDRTVEVARKYADKVIQQKSKGIGGARNDGVKVSKGNIIATTDADCVPFKNWIERVQKSFEKEKIIGVFGLFKPIDFNGLSKLEKIMYKLAFDITNFLVILTSKIGYYHLCGTNCAFDHKAFLKIGGYRDLPQCDDIEIVRRLRPFGKIILDEKMRMGTSIRRIKKMGMKKYIALLVSSNYLMLMLEMKTSIKDYARQEYP